MATSLSELMSDESQYVEILTIFNERICVPICRSGVQFGLQNKTILTEVFNNFSKLHELHKTLHNDLHKLTQSQPSNKINDINNIFEKYVNDFNKIDIYIMDRTYEYIEEIFELSYNINIINIIKKINHTHSYSLISYMLYLIMRVYRYINYYNIYSLFNSKYKKKCIELYNKTNWALYLLCLQKQISQCQIKLFIKNRIIIRLEKLNMEAGKFKKKQKERLLILFNDRILWCSILPNTTKRGENFKYKGSYKIKDDCFQIKPFYYDSTQNNNNNEDDDDDESAYSTNYPSGASYPPTASGVTAERFGFKFGEQGNEKSLKVVICSETQQQFWCKDINKFIDYNNNNHDISYLNEHISLQTINVKNINLFEGFLKHATVWSKNKIWTKIFNNSSKNYPSLLTIILSLFYEKLSKQPKSIQPPPLTINHSNNNITDNSSSESDEDNEEQQSKTTQTLDSKTNDEIEIESVSSVSDRSSVNGLNEVGKLKQEIEKYKKELSKLQEDYKQLESDNIKLCSRNTFLNNRLLSYNKMFSSTNIFNHKTSKVTNNSVTNIESNLSIDIGDSDLNDGSDDAEKCMKMISHRRKNSDSQFINKSPSFLSTLTKEETLRGIDNDEFYLDGNKNGNGNGNGNMHDNKVSKQHEEKMVQPSKSRDEIEIVYRHKKKPRKKIKHQKHRKSRKVPKISHRKTKSSDSTPSLSNSRTNSDY